MTNIITTMKIHNHLIVSTIQILNKSSPKNKNKRPEEHSNNSEEIETSSRLSDEQEEENINSSREDINSNTQWYSRDDYYIDYDSEDYYSIDNNEREECEECDKLILKRLLYNGLCEMCLNKMKRRRVIKKHKNKN